jgi:hypothetical protein
MWHIHGTTTRHPRHQTDACALSVLWDRGGRRQCGRRSMITDNQANTPMILSILFRINGMEARRMTGRQQLRIGADNGQPQGLEFQCQCQMQDLW